MPRTILKADNSQISTFLRCQREWYYTYIRNLESVTRDRKALDKGTVVHALLDVYYKLLGHLEKPWEACRAAQNILDKSYNAGKITGLTYDELSFIKTRFIQYVAYYQKDFFPLVINGRPQVEIGFSIPILDDATSLFVLEGRIDMITTDEMFVDHKSQERRHDYFAYDTQWLTYAWATGLKKGAVNYFGLQQKLESTTFRRQALSLPHDIVYRYNQKIIEIFRQMALCIEVGYYEMNESSCPGKFGKPCQFGVSYAANGAATGPCYVMNDDLREQIIKIQYKQKEPWEPWTLAEEKI